MTTLASLKKTKYDAAAVCAWLDEQVRKAEDAVFSAPNWAALTAASKRRNHLIDLRQEQRAIHDDACVQVVIAVTGDDDEQN